MNVSFLSSYIQSFHYLHDFVYYRFSYVIHICLFKHADCLKFYDNFHVPYAKDIIIGLAKVTLSDFNDTLRICLNT